MTSLDAGIAADAAPAANHERALSEALKLVRFAKFDDARRQLDDLRAITPADPRIAHAQGIVAQRTGNTADAIAHFKSAMALDPGFHQAAESAGALLRAATSPVAPPLDWPVPEPEPFV